MEKQETDFVSAEEAIVLLASTLRRLSSHRGIALRSLAEEAAISLERFHRKDLIASAVKRLHIMYPFHVDSQSPPADSRGSEAVG